MSSLTTAKNLYEQSQGDCTDHYSKYLKEQAQMYVMFAIAEQLQEINETLEFLREQITGLERLS